MSEKYDDTGRVLERVGFEATGFYRVKKYDRRGEEIEWAYFRRIG